MEDPEISGVEEIKEDTPKAKEEKYYIKAKIFKFHNIYQNYDRKHESMRMIDYQIAVYDKQTIRDLDIIQFIHDNNISTLI